MSSPSYDALIVGGGLGGAAVAKALAGSGMRVLVIERERQFKDRVRGEQMQPWGVAEARTLDIYELLRTTCGHEQPWIDMFLGPVPFAHRHLPETTPSGAPHFNFHHPRMQEVLLDAAAEAGADVRRGATVMDVRAGTPPTAIVGQDGAAEEITARLVVAADGRTSGARRWRPFTTNRDQPFLMIAGLLVDGLSIRDDTGLIFMNPQISQGAYLFPQGGGRARVYVSYPVTAPARLQGEKDVPAFIDAFARTGAPSDLFAGSRPAGPLASFDAADAWVDHPYADGLALIGDAAASNDPAWGQGMSLALRDARTLRDRLLETEDWDAAAHAYADEHDRYYRVIHEVSRAFHEMFMFSGPEADARRARALPLIAADPRRVPDHLFAGPELPWNAEVRRRFFAEDVETT